jgi:thiamine kinase-like enzyme
MTTPGSTTTVVNTLAVSTLSAPPITTDRCSGSQPAIYSTPDTVYRDNADAVFPVAVHPHASEEERDQQIRTVIAALCPHLLRSDGGGQHELQIVPLLGGLSNELFIVEARIEAAGSCEQKASRQIDCTANRSVLLRIHPDGDGIVEREAENRLSAWLSSQTSSCASTTNDDGDTDNYENASCGTSRTPAMKTMIQAPIFYGRFENGRVEEFFPNHAPLSYPDMQEFGPDAAELLSALHKLSPPPHVLSPAVPGTDDVWVLLHSWYDRADRLRRKCQVRKENNLCRKAHHGDKIIRGSTSDERLEWLLSTIRREVAWLKSKLLPKPSAHPADVFALEPVLTHMDAQPLNFLLDLDHKMDAPKVGEAPIKPPHLPLPRRLKLIDYEYAGFNARVMDLGNTWCEYMDMNPSTTRDLSLEWESAYPSEEQQEAFLRAYLDGSSARAVDDSFVGRLRQLVNVYSLVSHLLWATWSCVQLHLSPIEFDYLQYADNRLRTYCHFRSVFFPEQV